MFFNTRNANNIRDDFTSNNITGGNGSGGISGILRKVSGPTAGNTSSIVSSATTTTTATTININVNQNESRQVDLLVFGYACKVFRDDVKALDIDQGKHLIPWMGDHNLKIDRYDVRGALYDLTPYEPPPGGYGNRLDYLTPEEQRAEQLCEEERYLFLYNDELDFITNQGKLVLTDGHEFRIVLHCCCYMQDIVYDIVNETNGAGYSQVDFAYDRQSMQTESTLITSHGQSREEYMPSPTNEESEQQAFQKPHNFEVPAHIQLPETMKQHAIIEKTARFIASQGVQMEILLKAKQSNNVQFEFLAQNSSLNAYYKHVVNAIKNGTYPKVQVTNLPSPQEPIADDQSAESEISGGAVTVTKPIITVPTIKYKPSVDCVYTQLISKIKGVPLPELHEDTSRQSCGSQTEHSNVASPCTTPVLLQYNGTTYLPEHEENSNSDSVTNKAASAASTELLQPQVEVLKNSSALALAQNYSSDSETEEEMSAKKESPEPQLEFPVPIENLKNIIDKTALYVVKNGRKFEETLLTKSEERFTFLLPNNEYYPYYLYKITGDPNAASKEQKQRKAAAVAAALLSKKGLTGEKNSCKQRNKKQQTFIYIDAFTFIPILATPVSFSIKSKDETSAGTLQQPVLPQDHSDEEDVASAALGKTAQQNRQVPEHVQKAIQFVESQLMARNAKLAAVVTASLVSQPALALTKSSLSTALATSYSKTTTTSTSTIAAVRNEKSHISLAKTEAERNAIYEQQQQNKHKEMKKAEEKVKDKLAQIAREKLGGLISKEKQLQLERKRKAMAFLNQIKGISSAEEAEQNLEHNEDLEKPEDDGNVTDDSETSVHSIPITSYGPEGNTDDDEQEEQKMLTAAHKVIVPIQDKEIAAAISNSKASTQESMSLRSLSITVSDDEDVQLVSDTKSRKDFKRRSRSKTKEGENRVLPTNLKSYKKHYRLHSNLSRSASASSASSNERRSHKKRSSKSHKGKNPNRKNQQKVKRKQKNIHVHDQSHERDQDHVAIIINIVTIIRIIGIANAA
uniref:SURP motif domain-containing protein n=1 Tax=Glossina morsitans morsitans TaxID=37546 RepID=A0A1B0G9T7_GLOMM